MGGSKHQDGWDKAGKRWEKAANKGPWTLFFKVIKTCLLLSVVMALVAIPFGLLRGCKRAASEAMDVAHEEFGPKALLTKYEWFKDAAAQLDKKRADIKVYDVRIATMSEDYGDTPRKDWDRTDKEQRNIWLGEMAGVKASYNGLAAEYNAQMAKFNWRFCEVGKLPQGATEPLPRDFKPYTEE
jgi:hypothetical protein